MFWFSRHSIQREQNHVIVFFFVQFFLVLIGTIEFILQQFKFVVEPFIRKFFGDFASTAGPAAERLPDGRLPAAV